MPKPPSTLFAVALAAITLIGPLSVHLFLPSLPQVKAAFGISDALAQFTFSVTLLTMAFTTLVYGALSDRYGRRPVLLTGLALFLVGIALAALAPTIEFLVLGRLIQAVGAGCGIALARAIARDAYGPERLVQAIAYLTMAYTLGPMIAPPLGGFLADTFSWRAVFGFAFAAGILILVAAYVTLYETHGQDKRAAQGPGILRGFGQLLKRPLFMAYVLQSGLSSGAFFGLASGSAFLMMDYLGRPATEYGFYFLLFATGYCLGNWISSRLSGRVAIDHMVLAGSIIMVSAVAVLIGFMAAGIVTPLAIFLPGLFVSMSQGIAMPNAQAGAIRTVPELAGTAAGIGVFSQLFCGGLFSQAYGFLADGTPGPVLLIVATGAVLCLVFGVAAFVLNREARARVPGG